MGNLTVDVAGHRVGCRGWPECQLAELFVWCVSPRLIAFGRQTQRRHLFERHGAGRKDGLAHAGTPVRGASSRS